jgi:hypothetical protein
MRNNDMSLERFFSPKRRLKWENSLNDIQYLLNEMKPGPQKLKLRKISRSLEALWNAFLVPYYEVNPDERWVYDDGCGTIQGYDESYETPNVLLRWTRVHGVWQYVEVDRIEDEEDEDEEI